MATGLDLLDQVAHAAADAEIGQVVHIRQAIDVGTPGDPVGAPKREVPSGKATSVKLPTRAS